MKTPISILHNRSGHCSRNHTTLVQSGFIEFVESLICNRTCAHHRMSKANVYYCQTPIDLGLWTWTKIFWGQYQKM